MPVQGLPAHLDLSISNPHHSIPFYDNLLTALGYQRLDVDDPEFQGTRPRRAAWRIFFASGGSFEIEIRPSYGPDYSRPVDRYAPGLHHLAFHTFGAQSVDHLHQQMVIAGATVLDAPADYTGRRGYCPGYYAAFYADPDGIKIEVAYIPEANP